MVVGQTASSAGVEAKAGHAGIDMQDGVAARGPASAPISSSDPRHRRQAACDVSVLGARDQAAEDREHRAGHDVADGERFIAGRRRRNAGSRRAYRAAATWRAPRP